MIKYILTDIEGTTTSISFVADRLFPYFLEHIEELNAVIAEPFVQAQLDIAKKTVADEEGKNINDAEAISYLALWCKQDRKHPALKALQGMIWEKGYQNGSLKGHLYPEVAEKLRSLKAAGYTLGVYSSGSVPAQKLLFGYSEAGDLIPLFSNYFDTAVGHKREVHSYQNIQAALQLEASEILFLSDIAEELDAAKAAGFSTCQLLRPGTENCGRHPVAASFEDLNLQ